MKKCSVPLFFAAVICAICAVAVFAGRFRSSASRRDIGLVLSSGGCKGAYHLGAWRALKEAGLTDRVAVISGTSVGALCSALFASVENPDEQELSWIDTLSVFQFAPAEEDVERIYRQKESKEKKWYGVDKLSDKFSMKLREEAKLQARHELMPKIMKAAKQLKDNPDTDEITFGAASFEPLRRNLDKILKDPYPRDAPVVYATALQCGPRVKRAFRLDRMPKSKRIDALCASAAIPVMFPPVKIDGLLWQDGGWVERGGDKTPIDPVLENHPEVKTVIVVHLHDEKTVSAKERTALRSKADAAGVRLIEVIPTENIGGPLDGWFGVFDTTPETMRRLISAGRKDVEAVIKNNFVD